jgi:predicted nucleotidyltransferase
MITAHDDSISQVLFGQTRRAVLGLLYGRPEESFYLRQIVRESGAGIGPVQRELEKLVKAGLVNRSPQGHQVYFRANKESPVYDELQSLVSKTIGIIDVLRRALGKFVESHRLDLAIVYGSAATGKQNSTSDIDLLLVGSVSLKEMLPILRQTQLRLGREINPTIYTWAEIREKLSKRSHFLSRVFERPRIVLFGNSNDLEKLAGSQVAHRTHP